MIYSCSEIRRITNTNRKNKVVSQEIIFTFEIDNLTKDYTFAVISANHCSL